MSTYPRHQHGQHGLETTTTPATRFATRLVLALFVCLLPAAASAAPVTYEFWSGSATVRATLAGQTNTIFEDTSVINTPLTGISVVIDDMVGDYGRLESLSITAADFSANLDETQVALDTIDVFQPTITSLAGSNLNAFGQFDVDTQIDAIVTGTFPNGTPFGPASVQSDPGSGGAIGIVSISGDQVLIQVVGVTVATFEQVASLDPNAPLVELKADFTFIGSAVTNPIPEPSAALLFGLGVTLTGAAVQRKSNA